jgi:hypothetical protein
MWLMTVNTSGKHMGLFLPQLTSDDLLVHSLDFHMALRASRSDVLSGDG